MAKKKKRCLTPLISTHTLLSYGSIFKSVRGVSENVTRQGNRIEVDFFTFLLVSHLLIVLCTWAMK